MFQASCVTESASLDRRLLNNDFLLQSYLQTVQRPLPGGAGGAAERPPPPRRALQERGRQTRLRRRPGRVPRSRPQGQSETSE